MKKKLKPWERFALWFLLTWAWCACATSKSSEVSFDRTKEVQTDRAVVKKVEKGPEKTVTTVEEFAPVDHDVDDQKASDTEGGGLHLAPDTRRHVDHGPLVKRTVTVTEQAPVTTTTEAKTATHQDTHSEGERATQSASKPSLGFLIWPWLLGLAGAALAGLAAWKFGLLGRLLGLLRP